MGNSWSSQLPSYSIIEENIFYHCDGENEIISVKSGFNTVRRNLFYESRGGLVCRHGHNNIIDSNVIIGNQLPGTSGIRIINQGHTVCNNYVEGVTGKGSSAAFILRMGVYERPSAPEDYEDEKLKSYHRAANIDIAFNTFVDCAELNFGDGQGDKEPGKTYVLRITESILPILSRISKSIIRLYFPALHLSIISVSSKAKNHRLLKDFKVLHSIKNK